MERERERERKESFRSRLRAPRLSELDAEECIVTVSPSSTLPCHPRSISRKSPETLIKALITRLAAIRHFCVIDNDVRTCVEV